MRCIRPALVVLAIFTCMALVSPVHAQFKKDAGDVKGSQLGESRTQCWKVGMEITAATPCTGIVGYVPVPVDWPEQQVKEVKEDISPQAKISYQKIDKDMKLMVVKIPKLPAGQTAHAFVTYEVKRSSQLPPETTDQYVLPDNRKLRGPIRLYLAPSPYIESRSPKILKLAREIGAAKPKTGKIKDEKEGEKSEEGEAEEEKELTPWQQVETVYDWVQEHVEYKKGKLKGALAALKDGTGDCEELSSLFIAICRAKGIPARTVWVPGHCYAEFYLEDAEGEGHWFPCQPAGSRAFGGIPEFRPVLQKGDSFRLPDDRKTVVRYLPERLKVSGTQSRPTVKFIRETVAQ